MKNFTFVKLLAACLGMAAASASAAHSSASSLGNFRVTLIDLDLTDGITPSFTLTSAAPPAARVLTLDQDSTLTAAGPAQSVATATQAPISTSGRRPAAPARWRRCGCRRPLRAMAPTAAATTWAAARRPAW